MSQIIEVLREVAEEFARLRAEVERLKSENEGLKLRVEFLTDGESRLRAILSAALVPCPGESCPDGRPCADICEHHPGYVPWKEEP